MVYLLVSWLLLWPVACAILTASTVRYLSRCVAERDAAIASLLHRHYGVTQVRNGDSQPMALDDREFSVAPEDMIERRRRASLARRMES